jgi:hypothetical protein
MRTRLDLLDDKLSEVRLQGWRIEARGGYFLFRIDHLHQIRGEYYTSRKVLIYGGDVIVTIDFNAETALADGLRPAFDAFLDTFQLNDPAAARLLVPEDDFVAEFKVPSGHLTIPVPRHFVRDDVAQSRTILARWSLARNVTLTLAQHGLPSIGLVPYGEYQIGVLADAGHSPGERGVVEFGDHTAYRIEFTTKAGTPGLFFVLDAQSRYYQLIFTADPVSYEMLAPVADAIVAKARLSPA